MKKILSIVLALVFCMSLASCSLLKPAETVDGTELVTGAPHTGGETDTPVSIGAQTEASTDTWGTASPPDTEPFVTGNVVIPAPLPGAPKHICIDAGHGYTDPGCTSEFLGGKYEREIVAEFALELKAVLEEKGYVVTLLRDDSRYVTAEEIAAAADKVGLKYMRDKLVDDGRFAAYNRAVWANVLHRDVFIDAYISLHIDSYGGPEEVRGTRLYYCGENEFSERSEQLCLSFVDRLGHYLPDMKPRYMSTTWESGFAVTKHPQMPSVLIEMGFATNEKDAEYILNPEWRRSFAVSIAEGFDRFFA